MLRIANRDLGFRFLHPLTTAVSPLPPKEAAIASRIAARAQSWATGQADAMAILMRRTLMRNELREPRQ
jgi:hypothetical protein